jgi:hypothetical protein
MMGRAGCCLERTKKIICRVYEGDSGGIAGRAELSIVREPAGRAAKAGLIVPERGRGGDPAGPASPVELSFARESAERAKLAAQSGAVAEPAVAEPAVAESASSAVSAGAAPSASSAVSAGAESASLAISAGFAAEGKCAPASASAAPSGAGLSFARVGMEDKPRFDALFRAVRPQISDLTFSNIMMWRDRIDSRVAWAGGFACIVATPREYPPYAYAPVGDMGDAAGFERAVRLIVAYFRDRGWAPRFRCVPAGVVPEMTRLFGSCRCEGDRDFYDYVYLASDLIGLRGKKFDGKRNHINKFRKTYEHEYEKLSPAHIDECLRIMYDRCVANGCGCLQGDSHACDRMASAGLLRHFGDLGCVGAIVKADGRYEAFTVGEALNADTAVIYIEKANASVQGIYSFINQQFCEREWSGMTYVNREEDEGVEGLRKAKLSYHPAKLIEKYTITL